MSLILKDSGDKIKRVTYVELFSEGMAEFTVVSGFVVVESGAEQEKAHSLARSRYRDSTCTVCEIAHTLL